MTTGADRQNLISSRSEAEQIEAEVQRLNDAVRDAARGRIHFGQEPASFLPMLQALADRPSQPANQAGAPAAKMLEFDTALDGDLLAAVSAIRAGRLSAGSLVEGALSRIAERDPQLGAVVHVRADAARDRARRLDEDAASGRWHGPLHGIPLAHKDCFERPGEPMRVGSRVQGPATGPCRATLLDRLENAGAIDLGALNLNEMVAGPTGQNPWFGDCRNAWDPGRISGGSSSGSATAVAAGLVYGSFGSDTGGSIRLPASMSGLFGLKPTYGRVSRAGCFPRAYSMDCVGPLARTAADAALLLHAAAGGDRRDPTSLDAPVPDYPSLIETAASGTRFATLRTDIALDPVVATALERFCATAAGRFDQRAPVSSPLLPACYAMADVLSKVEAATLHAEWMRASPQDYSQAVYSRTEPGFRILAVRYLEALSARPGMLRDFIEGTMSTADVLVLPTVPIPVPTRKEADMEARGRVFGVVAALTSLTRPFSYLGLPVLSMPIGRDSNNMPIGVQLVGRPLGEARLLSMAHLLTADLGWTAATAPYPHPRAAPLAHA